MEVEDAAERAEYTQALGVTSSGLDRVNTASYDALGLMSFYTAGEDECRAWTIPKNSQAPVAGGKVHTDIERGFIRAEVIKLNDYVEAGSEGAARNAGKVQTRGRDYVVEDGDVIHFLFSV
jgi:ribosome-binding ATPase YchF (GTP1/OBG family)